jgi:cytidine deaminase
MQKYKLEIVYEKYKDISELSSRDQELVVEARESSNHAYAPYSNFYVGAAVLLENGVIVRGSNQENAAYPAGLCAERVAVFAAGAQHPGIKIIAIAVTAHPKDSQHPSVAISPCGDCRQVMAEYEYRYAHKIRIIMEGGGGKFIISQSVGQLLPFIFSSDHLKDN